MHRFSVLAIVGILAALLSTSAAAGAQTVMCAGKVANVVGTTNDDVLRGTPGDDVIAAFGGDDVVYGYAGDDIICGGHGNDRLYGGDGADTIYSFNGADHVEGGKGPDVIFGGRGADVLIGQNGQDTLKGGPGLDNLDGGAQRDILRGGLHPDTLVGGTELDTCYSPGDDVDCEKGGSGKAALVTTQYADEMFRLINVERNKHSNLGSLSRASALDSYARDWAVIMSQQPLPLASSRHHSPAFTGSNIDFRDLPSTPTWNRAFENVGYSTVGTGENVASVMNRLFYSPNGFGFMSSPGHKCNILETAATSVGLGAYVDSNGDVWVVQVFSGNLSPTPAAVADCSSTVGR